MSASSKPARRCVAVRLSAVAVMSWLAAGCAAPGDGAPEQMPEGWLCCNMRTDGAWISDINYKETHKTMIPLGTPVKVTGYGRYRVHTLMDGKRQDIGNDYSRDLDLSAFARRYVWAENPLEKLASASPKVRKAVMSARVTRGMTREQVLMAVGYPVSSENPHFDADVWRFWLWSFQEFRVVFDKAGRVRAIETDPVTRRLVVLD